MVEPSLLRQVLELPAEDRSELMHEIAESLTVDVELTPGLVTLISERLDDMETNPDDWRNADDVERDLRSKFLA